MKKKWIAVFLIFTIMVPVSGFSEEKAGTDPVTTLDEVVVTATKTKEKIKDVPNSVITKDSMDIEESPAASLGEFLANEPGLDWRSRGNYGGAAQEIHIRGMEGDEVQVLMNGISINSPSLGLADLSMVPMNNIEKVEVVKGAGSVLYGSGAMAGTVNIITKSPDKDSVTAKIGAGYGSDGTYRISAENGMFVTDSLGYYLTADHGGTEGQRDNGGAIQNDSSLKLVFDKGKKINVSLYGDYLKKSFGIPGIKPPQGTQAFSIGGTRFYDDESASLVDSGREEDKHLVMNLKSRPLPWMGINLKGYYTGMENYNLSRYNSGGWTTLAGEGMKTWIHNRVTGVEGNIETEPMAGASVLIGYDVKRHNWNTSQIDLDQSGAEKPGETANNHVIDTKGAYAEGQYRLNQYAKLLAGVREENHSTFGTEYLPHYGLILEPLKNTVLKVNHGKHFKAPTPNDLFWPEDDFARGNPDLKPQTGWHTDATLDQGLFDDKLFASVSVFKWNVDNKIDWAENPSYPGPYGNKWTPSNVNKSSGSGWETKIKFTPLYAFQAVLSYSHTNAENKINGIKRKAQYVAEHRIKTDLVYRSQNGLTAMASVRYVSSRDFYRSSTDIQPTDKLGAYYTADIKVKKHFLEHWAVALEGSNIFDVKYDTYMGSYVDGSGTRYYGPYPGAGRSAFVSMSYEY